MRIGNIFILLGILGGSAITLLAATPDAEAVPETEQASNTPYRSIVDRNIFNLKAPKSETETLPPPTPPQKITLSGITTILGSKVALLRVALPAKPPEPAKEESYMLTEGQGAGGIEVLTIDEVNGVVKVTNRGISQTVDFKNNGSKLSAVAAFPVANTVVGAAANAPQGAIPPPPGPAENAGRIIRPIRTTSSPQSQPTGPGVVNQGVNPPPQYQSQQSNLSREEQIIAIEVERVRLQNENDASAVLLPPTELSPE